MRISRNRLKKFSRLSNLAVFLDNVEPVTTNSRTSAASKQKPKGRSRRALGLAVSPSPPCSLWSRVGSSRPRRCLAKESWSAPPSFREGHDQLGVSAVLLDPRGQGTPARPARRRRAGDRGMGTDRWEGLLTPSATGNWSFVIEAWHDRYGTWHHNAEVKVDAGIDVELMLAEGAALLSQAAEDACPQRSADRRTLRIRRRRSSRDTSLTPEERLAAGFSARRRRRRRPPADPRAGHRLRAVPAAG